MRRILGSGGAFRTNNVMRALLAVITIGTSMAAHAQLTSVDNGAAAIDGNGLMWANTVGVNLPYAFGPFYSGTTGEWVANLNASNYDGYNDWSLPTGDYSTGVNNTTNQLGQLFYADCGNSVGSASSLSNPGKNCTALSALNTVMTNDYNTTYGSVLFSSTTFQGGGFGIYGTNWQVYLTIGSIQQPWNYDTNLGGLVGRGDALAVRRATLRAPEIDPASTASALTLLLGGITVMRGRKRHA